MATTIKSVSPDQSLPGISISSASWIAEESTSWGTKLTDALTLTSGKYIIIIKSPSPSSSNKTILADIVPDDSSAIEALGGSLLVSLIETGDGVIALSVTSTVNIYIRAGSSASISWGNLERGGLTAIRLCD